MADTYASFVHLHVHGEYSLLDGTSRARELAERARDEGMPAIALTDHGSLAGAYEFDQACRAVGVKPILGCEFYKAIGSRHEKNELSIPSPADGEKTKRYEHVTLLATSQAGWRSLVRLHNESYQHVYSKPRIDTELLSRYNEGLLLLTGCLGGPIIGPLSHAYLVEGSIPEVPLPKFETARDLARLLKQRQQGVPVSDEDIAEAESALVPAEATAIYAWMDYFHRAAQARLYRAQAEKNLRELVGIFGRERVFVEIMSHGIDEEEAVIGEAVALARKVGVGIVATNDSHYTDPEDALGHDGALALQTARGDRDAPGRFRFHGEGYHVRTEEEMRSLRKEDFWQEACDTTVRIADMVAESVLPASSLHLPHFPVPSRYADAHAMLSEIAADGAARLYGTPLPKDVRERLDHELEVIGSLGLDAYFLITHDMIAWARSPYTPAEWVAHLRGEEVTGTKKPIVVGPGRGSAAGSVVLYCLGITRIDPLAHGLLFARFLDPTRVGMPDVDTDFEKGRRDEVYGFLAYRYGANKVARLGAIGTRVERSAAQAAGRLVGMPASWTATLSTSIPEGASLMEILHPRDPRGEKARALLGEVPYRDEFLYFAEFMKNRVATQSIHACGVVISDTDLNDFVPCRRESESSIPITCWDGVTIDALGLLKLDALGLKTLDVIAKACEFVSQRLGKHITIDDLPTPTRRCRQTREAFELLARGDTEGVFQFSSAGMRDLLVRIAPREWAHITSAVALYRPGPLGMDLHIEYADRLHGLGHDVLLEGAGARERAVVEGVLGETLGIPIYQEQAMQLASDMAGFSVADVNRLRKAISKKKQEEFPSLGGLFVQGSMSETTSDGRPKVAFSQKVAEKVWQSLEASAQYSFNKSHSASYALVGFYTAVLKAAFPAEFYAAYLSVIDPTDSEWGPIIADARAHGVEVNPPDVNLSGLTPLPREGAVYLGLTSVKGVSSHGAGALVAERERGGEFTSFSDVCRRMSHLKKVSETTGAQVRVFSRSHLQSFIHAGAFDSFGPRLGQFMFAKVASLPEDKWDALPDFHVPAVEYNPLERYIREVSALSTPLRDPQGIIPPVPAVITDASGGRCDTLPSSCRSTASMPDGAPVKLWGVVTQLVKRTILDRGIAYFLTLTDASGSAEVIAWPTSLPAETFDKLEVGALTYIDGIVRHRALSTPGGDDTEDESVQISTSVFILSCRIFASHQEGSVADTVIWEDTPPLPAPKKKTTTRSTKKKATPAGVEETPRRKQDPALVATLAPEVVKATELQKAPAPEASALEATLAPEVVEASALEATLAPEMVGATELQKAPASEATAGAQGKKEATHISTPAMVKVKASYGGGGLACRPIEKDTQPPLRCDDPFNLPTLL